MTSQPTLEDIEQENLKRIKVLELELPSVRTDMLRGKTAVIREENSYRYAILQCEYFDRTGDFWGGEDNDRRT